MDELGIDKFYIELVDDYPCNDKLELLAREGYWIKQIGTLNKQIQGRTKKEWREDNKEYIQEKRKEYREENNDKIKEKKKEYYHSHKEEDSQRCKEYYQNNKETIISKAAKYRETHKEEIKLKRQEEMVCECGLTVKKYDLGRHLKSKTHQQFIEEKDEAPN